MEEEEWEAGLMEVVVLVEVELVGNVVGVVTAVVASGCVMVEEVMVAEATVVMMAVVVP